MGLEAATIGLIINGIGAGAAVAGGVLEAGAREEASDASIRAERARQRQARLEETQRRRQLIRSAIVSRATALSNVTSSTGSAEGSAFGGVASSYGSQYAANVGNTNQSAAIRDDIFDANAAYSTASADAQNYGSVGQFGKDLFNSSEKLSKLFSSY